MPDDCQGLCEFTGGNTPILNPNLLTETLYGKCRLKYQTSTSRYQWHPINWLGDCLIILILYDYIVWLLYIPSCCFVFFVQCIYHYCLLYWYSLIIVWLLITVWLLYDYCTWIPCSMYVIFTYICPKQITQFCRYIFQHHGAYGECVDHIPDTTDIRVQKAMAAWAQLHRIDPRQYQAGFV